jgi:lipopolysaccharide/colanic/teichoic acid biosynthesis glycosyltransferase
MHIRAVYRHSSATRTPRTFTRTPPAAMRVYQPDRHPSLHTAAGGLKRAFDVLAVLVGGALLLPLLLLVALAIRLDSRGPVLFRQRRVGDTFRSMYLDAEQRLASLRRYNEMQGPLFKMRNDPRVTRMGRFIRRTSLDELPQLLNVLVGDMSLVGPRPPLPSEVAHFEPAHNHKFDVKPGITGLWQVSGRNALTSFEEMIELDLAYIRNWTLGADLRILARTVGVVLTTRGAS